MELVGWLDFVGLGLILLGSLGYWLSFHDFWTVPEPMRTVEVPQIEYVDKALLPWSRLLLADLTTVALCILRNHFSFLSVACYLLDVSQAF